MLQVEMVVQERVVCHYSALLGKDNDRLEEFQRFCSTIGFQSHDRPQINIKVVYHDMGEFRRHQILPAIFGLQEIGEVFPDRRILVIGSDGLSFSDL